VEAASFVSHHIKTFCASLLDAASKWSYGDCDRLLRSFNREGMRKGYLFHILEHESQFFSGVPYQAAQDVL